MKRIFTIITCLSMITGLSALKAQTVDPKKMNGPVIQFENTHHDFGNMKEDDGDVVHVYKFKNIGKEKLKLTQVQPACGCTIAEYTKEFVDPGKEGYVKATFSVAHKQGRIDKSITVHTNGEPEILLLTFGGTVLPHVKTMEDSFAQVIGSLRFENNTINFDRIANNVKDTVQYLNIYNSSNSPIMIKEIKTQSKYIFNEELPITLPPKKRTKFAIHYSPAMVDDYGIVFDQFKLVTNDPEKPEKSITLFADIHQFVPKMTDEEKAKAASILFEKRDHNFGNVKQGDEVSTEFVFRNVGKKDLLIYKVKPSCGCTVSSASKSKLKPGESSTIKATFNSAGMVGSESKTVTIVSNDPVNPEIVLTLKSTVLAPDSGAKQ